MSIASRITSMEQHIGNAYDKLDELGVDLTNVNKNINNIAGLLDEIYEDYPKTTTTNVTEPSINNTKAGKMEIDLKGNTDQFTTTGKNFLNLNSMAGTTTSTGVTITPILKNNLLQYIKLTGTPSGTFWYQIGSVTLEPGDYIFSGIDVNNTGLKIALNTSALYIDKDNPTLALNLTTRYTYTINIWCNNSSLYPTGEIKLKPMIRLSSIADDTYEPYTGATASPNPDYPQDVEVVTGENTVKVVNKNLFDEENATIKLDYAKDDNGNEIANTDGNYTTTYTKVFPNTTYTFSYNLSSQVVRIYCYDEEKSWISRTSNIKSSSNNYTFTTPSNCCYLQFQNVINFGTAQLEQGSTATTYVEHKEQDFTISLGNIELCKIGDYKDYPWKDESTGKWYVKKLTGKGNADDLSVIVSVTSTIGADLYAYACNVGSNINSIATLGSVISNIFTPRILGSTSETTNPNNVRFNMGISKHTSTAQIVISILKTYLNDGQTQTFKTFLQNNNFMFMYILATPIDIEITDTTLISQLEAIYNTAKSYDNVTNITQENNDLPFILDIKTLKKS